jgi:hypothetical protein
MCDPLPLTVGVEISPEGHSKLLRPTDIPCATFWIDVLCHLRVDKLGELYRKASRIVICLSTGIIPKAISCPPVPQVELIHSLQVRLHSIYDFGLRDAITNWSAENLSH